jgi:hypothetical protein
LLRNHALVEDARRAGTKHEKSLGTIAQTNAFRYSPAADGQRFLVNADATAVQPSLELILNWGRTSSGK